MEGLLKPLSDRDRRVLEEFECVENGASSWDSRSVGDTPVVLVIDMQRFIVGDDVPIFEAIQDHQLAIGEDAWDAMDVMEPLLETTRDNDVPVMYTRIVLENSELCEDAFEIADPVRPEPT